MEEHNKILQRAPPIASLRVFDTDIESSYGRSFVRTTMKCLWISVVAYLQLSISTNCLSLKQP